jgi:hypothetical protein
MPTGKNWIHFLYINIAFLIYSIGVFYYNQVNTIKANWPLYRCNPIYMPLADNIEENFTYCIQSMQTNYMGTILQPLTYITASLTGAIGDFGTDINMVRAEINNIRNFFSTISESIFGVFLNLVIEFQKISIGIRDLIGKTIGVVTTLMYVMEGSIMTAQSTWNGPPGQIVQALGKCFYPKTYLKLKDGSIKMMKNIKLGDVLEDDSIVETIMKIDNTLDPVPLYVIKKEGVQNKNIYVTGSHLVYDKDTSTYIKVEEYKKAVLSKKKTDWFSCLITKNHKIKIGNETFWDWEDHFIKIKMK